MGSSSKKSTIGYRYYLGFHTWVCRGPIDKMLEIRYGDREAFKGQHSASGPLFINKPDLFGGDSKEGGIYGVLDIEFGEDTQTPNAYLERKISGVIPAFRSVVSVIANQIQYSAMNPYMKDWWFRPQRLLARVFKWYPSKVDINGHMNPAHICVDVLTDPEMPGAVPSSALDLDAFEAAADILYDEDFGLSFFWKQQTSKGDFLNMVMDHIGGIIYEDPTTGKFVLSLLRDGPTDGLPVFNVDNATLLSFDRKLIGETTNALQIIYTRDDNGEDAYAPPVYNLGNIRAQGNKIVSKTQRYPGVYDEALALRLGERDLKIISTDLAKAVIETGPEGEDLVPGSRIKLTFPEAEIEDAVFRVVDKDETTINDLTIKLALVQDVFGLGSGSYITGQTSTWIDTSTVPADISDVMVVELPYYDVETNMSKADFAALDPDWAFSSVLAQKDAGDSTDYGLLVSPDNSVFTAFGRGDYTPTAIIDAAVDYLDGTISIGGWTDVDDDLIGQYAYVVKSGSFEIVEITSLDLINGTVGVGRGILDTIPQQFSVDDKIWFGQELNAVDEVERVLSETVYYKLQPSTSRGELAEGDASSHNVTMANRAQRPYPPGAVKINNGYFPASITGPVDFAWTHRDKTIQTADYHPWTTGNIGPEVGIAYTLKIYGDGGTLKHTELLITNNYYVYPEATEKAENGGSYNSTLQIELWSEIAGLASMQVFDYSFVRV